MNRAAPRSRILAADLPMGPTYEGAARRLARVLELSSQATQEIAAMPRGKRARQDDARRIAAELSKALVVRPRSDEDRSS